METATRRIVERCGNPSASKPMTSVTPLSAGIATEPEGRKPLQLGLGTHVAIDVAVGAGEVQGVRLALLEVAEPARHRAVRVWLRHVAIGEDVVARRLARNRAEAPA